MSKEEKNPYCFGNYSDCACNQCWAVKECIVELAKRNAEFKMIKWIES